MLICVMKLWTSTKFGSRQSLCSFGNERIQILWDRQRYGLIWEVNNVDQEVRKSSTETQKCNKYGSFSTPEVPHSYDTRSCITLPTLKEI
jgi:hypothetical protein